ncbi:MAG: FtsX-like permease family protein [Magnetococcales bacterium]|nr:FtsX-like permease family protein [Magnetococcales bacterium]
MSHLLRAGHGAGAQSRSGGSLLMLAGPYIGFQILLHDKKRLLRSIGGIAFAVTIMFMQLGFFNGINDSQAHIATLFNADLVVMHKNRTHLTKWNRLLRIYLEKLRIQPGVAAAIPLYKDGAGVKNPQTDQIRRIIVYAFPPDAEPFHLDPESQAVFKQLHTRKTVLFDRASRPIYGQFEVGDPITIGSRTFTVGGFVNIGPNIINDGAILTSESSWLFNAKTADPLMGMIRFHETADPAQVVATIKAALPDDLIIMTPAQAAQREIDFIVETAPVGVIFGIGLIVSLFIGVVICYQILYNEVIDHIPQYATLMAMGFKNSAMIRIILEQSLLLSILGFLPGLMASLLIYQHLASATQLLMHLTTLRVAFLFILTVVMCLLAGMLAIREVLKLDPADLF